MRCFSSGLTIQLPTNSQGYYTQFAGNYQQIFIFLLFLPIIVMPFGKSVMLARMFSAIQGGRRRNALCLSKRTTQKRGKQTASIARFSNGVTIILSIKKTTLRKDAGSSFYTNLK